MRKIAALAAAGALLLAAPTTAASQVQFKHFHGGKRAHVHHHGSGLRH
jgi:hypothetical protein